MKNAVGVCTLLLAGVAAAASQAPVAPQEPSQVFPGVIEQVTVDVVVVDKKGNPVLGLTRDDFTVLDENRPQNIATFDVVQPPATGTTAARPDAPPRRARVVTNLQQPEERGRLFVIVFDDIHMSPLNARRAKSAVAEFLKRGTREGDRVTLVASGGDAFWSTRLEAGYADLLAVLKHLDGRRIPDNALERLTDQEAMKIFVYQDVEVAMRVQERLDRYGTTSRQDMQDSQQQAARGGVVPGMIDMYVESRASETYMKLKARMNVTLGLLDRVLRSLEDNRDRKAVLLVSEGFVYDSSQDTFRKVTEAARRSNAAVYFIDTRGLESLSTPYSAEFGPPFPEKDLMKAIADVSLEGEGAAVLAGDTGGFAVRNTNDFAGGAARIGLESSSYYLLGYNPGDIPRDGHFRKLEVRVRQKGLTVRARRGYYAPGGDAKAAPPPTGGRDAGIQRGLDSPGALDAVPLRTTAYVQEESSLGKARVVVGTEVDVARVAFPENSGKGVASLDTLVVVAHRDSGEFQRSDQRVELERRTTAPTGHVWYSFLREFDLVAGSYQAKVVVRDGTTQRVGSLIYEFEVPPLDRLRVSTPILSDRLQEGAGASGPAPALLVGRDLASGGTLYCRFDVYGAAKGKDGMPRVQAGHELRRSGGASLGRSSPRLIEPTSIGALARMIQIPLRGVAAGDYELVLTVRDQLSAETRELIEPFTVADSAQAAR